VLNIELMRVSSDHHVFMSITTSCRRDGSESAHGKGYFESQRLTIPASSAAGTLSGRIKLSVPSAFFSPRGLVLGKIGDIVEDVSSVCSLRKLQRHSTRATYVGRSCSRAHTEVRETRS
jgi:hypothetical protein